MAFAENVIVGHFPVYVQDVAPVSDCVNLGLRKLIMIGIQGHLLAGLDNPSASYRSAWEWTINGLKRFVFLQGVQHHQALKIEGWGMPTIYCVQAKEKVEPRRQIRRLYADNSNPSSLIQMKVIDGRLERSRILRFLSLVAAHGFILSPAGYIDRFLGYSGLPDTNCTAAECRENQETSKPCQPFICLDLLSRELVLLILASAAGCFFFILRGIKNDSISLPMVVGYLSLFLIGQFAVYLLCKGIYGI